MGNDREHPKKGKENGVVLPGVLSSLRFTIILLFLMAFMCVIGTIFPQGQTVAPQDHGWLSRAAALFSPYDIFHSVWFMGTSFLLCINLILCMKQRTRSLTARGILVLILHGSIVTVIAGFTWGYFSLDAFMEIPEGGSSGHISFKDGTSKTLDFSLCCDSFRVDYYPNGMPSEFISRLSFIKDGRVVHQASVKVNHPAGFSGMEFYQESYRQLSAATMAVSDGRMKVTIRAQEGDLIPLSPGTVHARVVKIWDNLMNAGPAVKLYLEGANGGRYIWIFRDIELLKKQVPNLFERAPELNPAGFQPYSFSLAGISSSYSTGIGVKKDPGTPLVAAGSAVFLACLVLVYLFPPKRKNREQMHPAPVDSSSKKTLGEISEGRSIET